MDFKTQALKTPFENVSLYSELNVPNRLDARGMTNPYAYKYSDSFMQKTSAPQYYPSDVRQQMCEFMTKASVNLDFPGK